MKHFDIDKYPDLIAAVNYSVPRSGGLDYISRILPLRKLAVSWIDGHCSCLLKRCCLSAILPIGYIIDKLSLSGRTRKAIEQFLEEIPNIKSLDLGYYDPDYGLVKFGANLIDQVMSSTFYFLDEVPLIIDYIITLFKNSTSLEKLDLHKCKLSPCNSSDDPHSITIHVPPNHVKPLLSSDRLDYVIATKIINMVSLRKVRILDKDFAMTTQYLLNEKKSLLLQELLGQRVDDKESSIEKIELYPLQDSMKLDCDTISIVGEYLSLEDIGINLKIVCE